MIFEIYNIYIIFILVFNIIKFYIINKYLTHLPVFFLSILGIFYLLVILPPSSSLLSPLNYIS